MSKNLILSVIIVIALIGLCTSCTKTEKVYVNGPTKDGGQDSGGGDFTESNPEDIKTSILKIHEKATIFRDNPLMYMFTKNFQDNLKNKKIKALLIDIRNKVLLGINEKNNNQYIDYQREYFLKKYKKSQELWIIDSTEFKIATLLSLSDIKFEEDDVCKANAKEKLNHKDAYVINHSIGSTICFNLKNISKYPKDTLISSITSLYLHEFMHILGYGEDIAKIMQSFVFNNFEYFQIARIGQNDAVFRTSMRESYLMVFRDIENSWIFEISERIERIKSSRDPEQNGLCYSVAGNQQVIQHNFKVLELSKKIEFEIITSKVEISDFDQHKYGHFGYYDEIFQNLSDISSYLDLVYNACSYKNQSLLTSAEALIKEQKYIDALTQMKATHERIDKEKAWIN